MRQLARRVADGIESVFGGAIVEAFIVDRPPPIKKLGDPWKAVGECLWGAVDRLDEQASGQKRTRT